MVVGKSCADGYVALSQEHSEESQSDSEATEGMTYAEVCVWADSIQQVHSLNCKPYLTSSVYQHRLCIS